MPRLPKSEILNQKSEIRSIPQAMARAAAFRLKTELWATLAAARAEDKRPDTVRLAMWARIGAAIQTFEKEMGI